MNSKLEERLQTVKSRWQGESPVARANRRRLKKTRSFAFSVCRAIFLFSLCLVLLYPLLVMLSISFRIPEQLYDPTVVWIPKTFSFQGFKDAFSALGFGPDGEAIKNNGISTDNVGRLINSGFISIAGTVLQLPVCMMAGYGMSRFKFKGQKVLFGLLLLTIIVPPQVVAIPSMLYMQNFDFFGLGQIVGLFSQPLTVNLRDTLFAYFVPAVLGAGIKSGLFIFIFIQFFRGLPKELQDSAAIDGCGRFKTFWRIMIPLSGSAILTVTLFSLVWYWNDSYFSVVYFDTLNTVSNALTSSYEGLKNALNQQNRSELAAVPAVQAAALIAVTPLLVMYTLLQKYFTESIERTGIVG